jgi:hypothetical protein
MENGFISTRIEQDCCRSRLTADRTKLARALPTAVGDSSGTKINF